MTALMVLALLAGDFGFSGVRSTVERKGPTLPAREKGCAVEVVEEGATRPREVVATVQVWVRRNKITMGKQAILDEALPELRKQACKLGADALLVRQQTVSHSGEFKLLYVKADAVHFTGPKPE